MDDDFLCRKLVQRYPESLALDDPGPTSPLSSFRGVLSMKFDSLETFLSKLKPHG